ncbi:MAG: DNA-formamidopyrimidine glycosylase [Candidatus Pacebacteria bacterium]|nr:DNA-formamidopyrimidine glycosylase [Candidatus Paceibacterota bacterium]
MPELPEVETTIRGLKPKVLNRTFVDIWANAPNLIKRPNSFLEFKKLLRNRRITGLKRAGKNILFSLSGGLTMLVHQKMTGHLLYGQWQEENGRWVAKEKGPLRDDLQNRFIHLVFFFDNGFQMALSDLRKFAKVEIWDSHELKNAPTLKSLGEDALKITREQFEKGLTSKKGQIKAVLMDQAFIAGVGNIYSDEILFQARVHPKQPANKLTKKQIATIHKAIKEVLSLAIKKGGTSFSDYRKPNGEKGGFSDDRKVYKKIGEKCPRCRKAKIARLRIGGRSAHFCPNCQR